MGPSQSGDDVSFAPWMEVLKGKSIMGWWVKYYGSTINFQVARTTRVCDSSSEAECNGLNAIRKEIAWEVALNHGLGLRDEKITPVPVLEDNTAAITLSGAAVFHKRSKHFGLDWYATKEAIEEGLLTPTWIATEHQSADMLTKPLAGRLLIRHREQLMGSEEDQLHFGTMTPPTPLD